jgi:hypothetical protein
VPPTERDPACLTPPGAARVGHQWVWWDRGFGDGLAAEINGWIAGIEVGVSP